jgi:hypothetical protein
MPAKGYNQHTGIKGNTYIDLQDGTSQIVLTQGQVTLIDTDKVEFCKQYTWFARWSKGKAQFLAVTNFRKPDGKQTALYLSEFLLGRFPYQSKRDGLVCDHRNNISLDNRLVNLQVCSQRENISKERKPSYGAGLTGAYWHQKQRKWRSNISDLHINGGKILSLGTFSTEREAHEAYLYARDVLNAMLPLLRK